MKIVMKPGDHFAIEFEAADGGFAIHYDSPRHPKTFLIKETAGLDGNVRGKANEILYQEDFGRAPADVDDLVNDLEGDSEIIRTEGFFMDANSQVRSTALTRCLIRELPGGERIVVTTDMDDTETGEFTFYETVQALQAQLLDPDDFRPEVI